MGKAKEDSEGGAAEWADGGAVAIPLQPPIPWLPPPLPALP